MKKSIGKFSLTTLAFLLSTVCGLQRVFAQQDDHRAVHSITKKRWDSLSVVIEPCGNEAKFRIYVLNRKKHRVSIKIWNGIDVDFVTTTIEPVFESILDMEQLNDGIYDIAVTDGEETVRETITLGTASWEYRWGKVD
ncbi:MAG TPA: hypothetical protein VNV35_15635 [Puia sp.]|jgi:hypothetical protein|nr:hypothetical protein [Puia sp.]